MPDGVQPLARFCCMIRNDGRILIGIDLIDVVRHEQVLATTSDVSSLATKPHGSSR